MGRHRLVVAVSAAGVVAGAIAAPGALAASPAPSASGVAGALGSAGGMRVTPRVFQAPPPISLPDERVTNPRASAPPRDHTETISNERTHTSWAYVLERAYARTDSNNHAHVVHGFTRCDDYGCYTSDDTPELVEVLKQRTRADGGVWDLVRLPMRPNNKTGWVPRRHLGRYHVSHTDLLINRRTLRATLWNRGKKVFVARIGVGKHSTPTPRGHYYVRERLTPTNKHGLYGPFAFGTSAFSNKLTDWPGGGIIGIHGTDQPYLIPGRPSHGCIRMHNSRISRLKKLMQYGTPITIR